ncbi:condensin subunit MukF [Thioalkalivibrio sp. HK1]|uniref:condensin subunit MukF n=1 Tax=Thioalkalivibrio sp. HK1 TaxID=1469245 RepID=UPI0004ACBB03|nr:condensin subunit MukF [Thioalkalivibrio sp. HK1]
MSSDANRLISALVRDSVQLDLKTLDLCFLAGLYLRSKRSVDSLEEDTLIDLFEQVCEVVEPDTERPRVRATYTIQRLRDQRLLARVDGSGIIRPGDYSLTRLATSIVEFFFDDERLTRESLSLLTGTLRSHLTEILAAVKHADTEQAWQEKVAAPLQVTVGDLVGGIERRQRGLDARQEEVQREIADLLQADWFGAVDRSQALLDTTTETLRELNEVLLRDTHHLLALLQDIQSEASKADQTVPEEAAQRLIEHIDRIGAWGRERQRAWSDYYQYVHRYLRDVVRLDPDRALSQRLRDLIMNRPSPRFRLFVASTPSIRLLRPVESRVERPAVMRPRMEREVSPDLVDPDSELDIDVSVKALVEASLSEGAETLAEITERVLAELPAHKHYIAAGRVADALAGIASVRSGRERPWRAVMPDLELEDWDLSKERALGQAPRPASPRVPRPEPEPEPERAPKR